MKKWHLVTFCLSFVAIVASLTASLLNPAFLEKPGVGEALGITVIVSLVRLLLSVFVGGISSKPQRPKDMDTPLHADENVEYLHKVIEATYRLPATITVRIETAYLMARHVKDVLKRLNGFGEAKAQYVARSSISLACPHCGPFNDEARDWALTAVELAESGGQLIGGPIVSSFAKGLCPGCNGSEVKLTIDLCKYATPTNSEAKVPHADTRFGQEVQQVSSPPKSNAGSVMELTDLIMGAGNKAAAALPVDKRNTTEPLSKTISTEPQQTFTHSDEMLKDLEKFWTTFGEAGTRLKQKIVSRGETSLAELKAIALDPKVDLNVRKSAIDCLTHFGDAAFECVSSFVKGKVPRDLSEDDFALFRQAKESLTAMGYTVQ